MGGVVETLDSQFVWPAHPFLSLGHRLNVVAAKAAPKRFECQRASPARGRPPASPFVASKQPFCPKFRQLAAPLRDRRPAAALQTSHFLFLPRFLMETDSRLLLVTGKKQDKKVLH